MSTIPTATGREALLERIVADMPSAITVHCQNCGQPRTLKPGRKPPGPHCQPCSAAHRTNPPTPDYSATEHAKPGPWILEGVCAQVDPELHYPEKGGSTAYAKRVCHSCPVKQACLDWAIATDQKHGVWGGMSRRERVQAAKQRREAAA